MRRLFFILVVLAPWQLACSAKKVQVESGEVIMSMFTDPDKRDVIYLANHNSYQPQELKLSFKQPVKTVALFNRQASQWSELKLENNVARFTIPPFVGELIRLER